MSKYDFDPLDGYRCDRDLYAAAPDSLWDVVKRHRTLLIGGLLGLLLAIFIIAAFNKCVEVLCLGPSPF